MTAPQVVLIGAPGAGKTTVGRLLAAQWGTGFRDTDLDVEATAGMPVSDIFIDQGEERFRELEREAVLLALAEHDGVLSVGGGAVLDPPTRAALSGHRVAYLVVSPAAAAKRVGLARDRPLLVGAPRQQLGALLKARAPLYTEVATVLVETDDRSPEDVAAAVSAALEEQDAP
jgi:shikimate kinase